MIFINLIIIVINLRFSFHLGVKVVGKTAVVVYFLNYTQWLCCNILPVIRVEIRNIYEIITRRGGIHTFRPYNYLKNDLITPRRATIFEWFVSKYTKIKRKILYQYASILLLLQILGTSGILANFCNNFPT